MGRQATRTLDPGDGGGGLVRHTVLPGGLRIGQLVTHAKFGQGVIVAAEGGGSDARVQVNFGTAGVKWLFGKDNFPADRDVAEQLLAIAPVARDVVEDNRAFRDKFEFPFRVLSDTDRSTSATYGAGRDPGDRYADFPQRIAAARLLLALRRADDAARLARAFLSAPCIADPLFIPAARSLLDSVEIR